MCGRLVWRCFIYRSVWMWSSSLRVVSTVTTTARWEVTITPTWPYLPATGCSKWTAVVFRIALLLHFYRLTIDWLLCFAPFLPGSGMFDDGVYMYLIEPLQQIHSIVSCPFTWELKHASYKRFLPRDFLHIRTLLRPLCCRFSWGYVLILPGTFLFPKEVTWPH